MSSLEPDSDPRTQGQGIYLAGKGYTRWGRDTEKGRQPTLACHQASHHRDQRKLNLSGQTRKAASMLISEVPNQGRGRWGISTPAPISSGLRTTPWVANLECLFLRVRQSGLPSFRESPLWMKFRNQQFEVSLAAFK